MKTVADLSFDDFRKIGKDAAEKAVADLRAAGHLAPEARETSKVPTKQHVAKSHRRYRLGETTSHSAEIHSSKALRYEKS